MRKFYQNKLWRDKLIQMREQAGAVVHVIPLAHAEYKEEINLKLVEEANEVAIADTHKEMVDEIADIFEAIDCILDFHGITMEEIMKHKEAKFLEFGSYRNHILVDYVEYPADSKEAQECLEKSDRYPELFEEDFEDDDDDNNGGCCQNC